ncbi:MAG: response regulator [Lachnospiraceae bacterium]|nr:response regulator [Lachnospiraceae bacterium]
MREEEQTSIHLLLAGIVTTFGMMLILITIAFSWEMWMVPVILIGNTLVWVLHIGRFGSEIFYESLCGGLLMVGFFFFGVHRVSLYDIPAVGCMMILIFSMFDKKRLLYMIVALYVLELLYHVFILHTIRDDMGTREMIRLGLGASVMAGSGAIARYRIIRRKGARKRYDNAFAQLEMAGRQNAVFLSNVSHELRTPINMVLGISEVVLEKENSPEIREDVRSIQLAGKRLSNQINNMLDYTEIVEGTLTAAKEEYMITSVLNDVITMVAMQSSRHQLEMVFDIDPRVPSVLIGDAEKISHVLKILLENSIKFTEEGGINICIEFRRESYGVNLVIDIYDTGIGMSNSQLVQMYDDFYQVDSGSSRFAGGLGLGLPIARGLLNAMGGFIHFESDGRQGLHAHITIPQGVADDSPAMVLSHPEQLCIACYFRPEKYSCDEVRGYYDKLILHLVEGLGLEGYQAHNFEGLLKLQHSHTLSHVFIAQEEYEENTAYYEELSHTLQVGVIAERDFVLGEDSRLLVIRKPFFALSVVNLLNGDVGENGFEEAQAAGRKPFSCVGVRVLAVDDEEMNLVVAKGVLGSYGIEVDTCLSGREAVERLRNVSYDVVFLDHMMPGFDGVETLKRIREINNGKYQDLPVIALTANTISGAREMFRNEGFTEFIPKPIERSVLERVLRRVLPRNCFQYGAEMISPPEAPAVEKEPEERAAKEDVPLKEASGRFAGLDKAGINEKMGLDYCCGEEEFYLEMLEMFCTQGPEKEKEIQTLYDAENWKDYAIKVHALKSTSLTIGAERLSEYAKSLELAGKKGDVEYIRQNHSGLLSMYEEVCAGIAGLETETEGI